MKINLGAAIPDSEPAKRDAIHVPLLPAFAGVKLAPGQKVYMNGHVAIPSDNTSAKPIGIVDPFLERMLQQGEKFWIMLYPDSITGIRHQWIHPNVLDEDESDFNEDDYDDGCSPDCG